MLDNETRGELLEQVEAFRAVDEMVKTAGWQKCVIPRIERYKEKYETILHTETKYIEIIRAQEAIKAADNLLSTLMMDIHDGEEAVKTLAEEKQE